MKIEIGKYLVVITPDQAYSSTSKDNTTDYENIYLNEFKFELQSKFGIKTYEEEELISSAIIGSIGGATGLNKNSTIVEKDKIIVCCSDSIFCLTIPELRLEWKTKADQGTCFEVFKYEDSYVIHGELEISRISQDGKILWQRSGADIFTTLDGKNDFEITDKYIIAKDWENRIYRFDFEGNTIN